MKHKRNNPTEKFYSLKTENNDEKECALKFLRCDDKHPLHILNQEELKSFVKFAKKVESMPWRNIKTYSGLNYEELPHISKPSNIARDITLHSMRVTKKFRLIGYREEQFFYIVWFDKNHEEC